MKILQKPVETTWTSYLESIGLPDMQEGLKEFVSTFKPDGHIADKVHLFCSWLCGEVFTAAKAANETNQDIVVALSIIFEMEVDMFYEIRDDATN